MESNCITLWLFNSLPWKITMLLIGKPSISMGYLYHGELLNNQRVSADTLTVCTTNSRSKIAYYYMIIWRWIIKRLTLQLWSNYGLNLREIMIHPHGTSVGPILSFVEKHVFFFMTVSFFFVWRYWGRKFMCCQVKTTNIFWSKTARAACLIN